MFIKENLTENDSRLGFSVTDFYVLTCTCIIRKSFLSLSHMIRFLMDRMKIIISNLKKQTFISLKTNVCIKLLDVYPELTLDICVHLLYNNNMLSDGFCICVVEIGLFSLYVWKLAR